METILARDLVKEYTSSYAKYVATSRSVCSLMDGLKPVQRRCINSASDLKLYHNKKHIKVSKLSGQVLGDYHPHGGANPVPLAQSWTQRYPMFEGQGNYGSPDLPNSYAAARYLEIRLSKFAEDFYLESADYADKEKNYDGRLDEITLYYPALPGCLFTGASGIAVGFSTEVPTHTIADIGNSLLSYLENKNSDKYLEGLYPETCEESVVLTPIEEIKSLYQKGEGSVRYKAKVHYETIDGKSALIVDAFPPGYSKKRLETPFILDSVDKGLLELSNESSEQVRYVFKSTDKSVLDAVEERLTTSIGYRMYIEHRGVIKLYKLKEIYDTFLEEKSSFIVRKYQSLLHFIEEDLDYFNILVLLKNDKTFLKTMFDKDSEQVIQEMSIRYEKELTICRKVLNTSLRSLMSDNLDSIQKKITDLVNKKELYASYLENPISKIKEDIQSLCSYFKEDKKRAVLKEDHKDSFTCSYRGKEIEIFSSSMYFLGKNDNTIVTVYGEDLRGMDLSGLCLAKGDRKFYFLYDAKGCCTVTKEILLSSGSKLNSKSLLGIIAIDDLSSITIQQGNNKIYKGVEWSFRKKSSYIRLSKEGEPDFRVISSHTL